MKPAMFVLGLALLGAQVSRVLAQDPEVAQSPEVSEVPFEAEQEPAEPSKLKLRLEAKAHYRDSDENRFSVRVPPEVPVPPGTQAFLETVNAGQHLELSTFTLYATMTWSEALEAHAKVDVIDLYDRNPTSEDHRIDVDEAWIRFGRTSEPARLPERAGAYLKIGKMPKFERQNDRHLESYGLISTAANRFEDFGVELGADLGRFLYLRGSVTAGNPLFFRDPNALAGDNGTPFFRNVQAGSSPPLKSGVLILYDAEVEDFDLDGDPEYGAGIGARAASADGSRGFDLLIWGYQRTLAKTVALHGTFYGGDLDLLNGPFDAAPVALDGDEKRDFGANLWLYLGGFTLFAQTLDQDIAGLERTGFEVEAAWRFDLPLVWGLAGEQLFPMIQPAVRYSSLDPKFRPHPLYPAPSIGWDWTKLDYGLRLGIRSNIDLTAEYADNEMTLFNGRKVSNNELLTTLRWKM